MKLFRLRAARLPSEPPSFGTWLFERVAQTPEIAELPFARLEQICSNAGSLMCGAVFAEPEAFRGRLTLDAETQREALLLARRTADGFQASLADRQHAVLTWPWDHLATRVAWQATQSGTVDSASIGRRLQSIGGAYGLMHREQLAAVLTLWQDVTAGLDTVKEPLDLGLMGRQMLAGYEASQLAG